MGLFDKLFKKKKVRNVRPPKQSASAGPSANVSANVEQKPLPVRPLSQTQQVSQPAVPSGQVPQRQQVQYETATLNAKTQRMLSEPLTGPQQRTSGPVPKQVKRVFKKTKKLKRHTRAGSGIQTPNAVSTGPIPRTTESSAQPVIKKTVPAASPGQKSQLFEDTMGEEELFKKLAQWDQDLKQKVPVKQVRPAAATTGPTPTIVRKPAPATTKKIEKDSVLDQREEELKKREAKLLQKEKKIKKMEDMNKLFSNLEDNELDQLTPAVPTVAPTPTIPTAAPDGVGEKAEFEDLLQPLKSLTFSNFIVGPSNRFAHDVSLSVAKAPADAYNPLFIYSQVGLGKTHLLCGIGNYIKSKNPQARIVYASSEKFTNELLDYLRLGEMESFRIKYRNVDVLLIDDIQFIGGQEGTQEEFFHTFNALYNAHKQIVITSDRPPKNIAHLKDRLRSRFEGGLIVNVKPPDLGTRTMILHEKAEKDGIYIPDEIINYIASKVKSNVRTLIGVLNRVVAHSSLTDRELDTSLVDDVLQDVIDEGLNITIT